MPSEAHELSSFESLTGKSLETPEGVGKLRTALQHQIAHPADLTDVNAALSQADRTILGYSTLDQSRATIHGFTPEQAGVFFSTVREAVDAARSNGQPLVEVPESEWKKWETHELDHAKKGVQKGLLLTEAKLRVSFGKEFKANNQPVIGIEIAVEPSPNFFTLHPVDQASILLAPEHPSQGDLIRAAALLKENRYRLADQPKESILVATKFMQAAQIGVLEFFSILKGK